MRNWEDRLTKNHTYFWLVRPWNTSVPPAQQTGHQDTVNRCKVTLKDIRKYLWISVLFLRIWRHCTSYALWFNYPTQNNYIYTHTTSGARQKDNVIFLKKNLIILPLIWGHQLKGQNSVRKKKRILKSKTLGEEFNNIQINVIINMHYTAPCLKPELKHLRLIIINSNTLVDMRIFGKSSAAVCCKYLL